MSQTPTSSTLPSILSSQSEWALTKYKQMNASQKAKIMDDRAAQHKNKVLHDDDITDIDMDMESHARTYGYAEKDIQESKNNNDSNIKAGRPALDAAIRANIMKDKKVVTLSMGRKLVKKSNAPHYTAPTVKVSNLSSISATISSARTGANAATGTGVSNDHSFRSRKAGNQLLPAAGSSGHLKTGAKLVAIADRSKNKPNFMQPIKQARRNDMDEHQDVTKHTNNES